MSSAETHQQGGQPNLQKQDLATLVRELVIKFTKSCGLASVFLNKSCDFEASL